MKTLLLADWIAPMDRPLIREGGVVFDTRRILEVGWADQLVRRHPDAAIEQLGSVVLLPGLVNAHTHLELSDLSQSAVSGGAQNRASSPRFVDWIESLMGRRMIPPDQVPAVMQEAITRGVGECLRFGITAVGDISRQCDMTRPLLSNSPLRVVSYGEIQAMAQRRGALEERLARAAYGTHATERLGIGLSPHAPYSVEEFAYRRCLQVAKSRGLPLATHLAETSDEAEFLANHAGPFRDLWAFLKGWDEQVPRFSGGPIRFADHLGLLEYPTLLAHVNYCDDAELGLLARGRASVVYCPRTHAYFAHPAHRWRDMLAVGINVAVGTDSRASSPDLNLVDDLRFLHQIAGKVPVQTLWEMATVRAARAIGREGTLGSVTPGRVPDFTVFPVFTVDPLREVLERSGLLPSQVWIDGRRVGEHRS
ncbi:MAG TPA: amidohydrolase family protein [Tepidisphaeraceae bacterium]|nr:amidohydrolase family protein [Tepidisphaeraceae bacterium]